MDVGGVVVTFKPLPPPLPIDQAAVIGVTVLGSCDWGGCHREAWGVRWDREQGAYLTVCHPCSRTSHRRGAA